MRSTDTHHYSIISSIYNVTCKHGDNVYEYLFDVGIQTE